MGFNLWDWLAETGEEILDFLSSPALDIARDSAKDYAREYHLDGDGEAFEELWGLTIRAMIEGKGHHAEAVAEVTRQTLNLRALTDRVPHRITPFGRPITGLDEAAYATAQVASTSGKYVIFSDHHMIDQSNRQNFFHTGSGGASGNRDLYVEVLEKFYGQADYCLIENGDVEELLIYEPVLSEVEGIGGWSWDRIRDYRESKKKPQLERIVRDNPDYYRVISGSFIDKKKYLRVTGNHDRDMSDQAFADIVSRVAGIDFPLASDVVLLTDGTAFRHIICHGHQFDTSCTPRYAERGGEAYSQASAWAYQGPDRVWREGEDPIDDWLAGRRLYANNLVTDEPEQEDGWDIPYPINLTSQELLDILGAAIGNLNTERGWENIYDKNIAWEYFDNAGDPQKCITREVKTGKKWFKFRHLNEIRLVNDMRIAFAGRDIPALILGHTHEPRLDPGQLMGLVECDTVPFYLNSGSAGRFENLVWGIELVDGAPSLISWHRSSGSDAQPIRTIWEAGVTGLTAWLRTGSSSTLNELLEVMETEPDDVPLFIAVEHVL